jgi:alpha-1,2-mannosyltransferase
MSESHKETVPVDTGSRDVVAGSPEPSASSTDRRTTRLLIAAVILLLVVFGWLAPFSSFAQSYDLNVYRNGGIAVAHGHDPYGEPPHYVGPYFTYPPFAAVAFTPLALLPLGVDRVLVTIVSLACVLLLALLSVRAERPARLDDQRLWTVVLAAAAIGLLLEPVRSTLQFGQINLLLATLVVADLVPRRRVLPQGVLIGVAAGMKLVPALFIVYLLLTHRLRAAAWAAGAFAATVATGFAVMPPAAGKYWTRYVFDTARAGPTGYVGNQSLRAVLTRLMGDSDHMRITWLIFCLVVVMAGLWIAVRLHGRDRELAAICAVALTGLLVSPISWQHHWVWALPIAVLLLVGGDTAGRKGWATAGVLWCLFFCEAPIWWVANPFAPAPRSGWRMLATNSYVLAGVAMLFALGFLARRLDARSQLRSPPRQL